MVKSNLIKGNLIENSDEYMFCPKAWFTYDHLTLDESNESRKIMLEAIKHDSLILKENNIKCELDERNYHYPILVLLN